MPTSQPTKAPTSEVAIFGRILANGQGEMSPELARYVLTLGFAEEDQARMRDLAERNQDGVFPPEEQAELMSFVRAGHLLALLHSKARKSLRKNRLPETLMDEALVQAVKERAGDSCEYCRVPQAAYSTVTFPVDHVVARQHGGPTALSNLANACLHCNSHKGPNIAGIDPATRKLFNPRRHKWQKHFRWDGPCLVGRTAVGRTTIAVLALNDSEAVEVRAALIEEGTFPPAD